MDHKYQSYAQCLLDYLCRTTCISVCHTKKKYPKCKKGCEWICSLCKSYSKLLSYAYVDPYSKPRCFFHFLALPIIHYWKGNTITIYNPITQSKSVIQFDVDFGIQADSISYHLRIYIIGAGKRSRDSYKIIVNTQHAHKISPIIQPKYYSTLCLLNEEIYSIGGYSSNKWLSNCQKYSIISDCWHSLPNMQCERGAPAVFSFPKKFIYSVFGYNGYNVNSVEKLKIGCLQWELVVICGEITARHAIHAIHIHSNKVIVFGGGCTSKETYMLEIGDTITSRLMKQSSGGEFDCCTAPIGTGKYVYGVDSQRKIHVYSIKDDNWDCIANE